MQNSKAITFYSTYLTNNREDQLSYMQWCSCSNTVPLLNEGKSQTLQSTANFKTLVFHLSVYVSGIRPMHYTRRVTIIVSKRYVLYTPYRHLVMVRKLLLLYIYLSLKTAACINDIQITLAMPILLLKTF